MSRWMRGLVALGAIVLSTVPFVFWGTDLQTLESTARNLLPGAHQDIQFTVTPDAQRMAVAALVPGVVLALFALLQVWHLFGAYGRGIVFGGAATVRLHRLGWALIATALLRPVTRTAVVLVLTLHNPPGQRQLLLSLDWQDYLALLFGGLLMAMAWAMAEGSRLEQENAGFV
jgi:hypothetical protein